MQIYRAYLDVHEQLKPSALSVSLNIVENHPRRNYSEQYRFDTQSSKIISILNYTPDESLFLLLANLEKDDVGYLDYLAKNHPSDRVKLSAVSAIASTGKTIEDVENTYKNGMNTNSEFLKTNCKELLARAKKSRKWVDR